MKTNIPVAKYLVYLLLLSLAFLSPFQLSCNQADRPAAAAGHSTAAEPAKAAGPDQHEAESAAATPAAEADGHDHAAEPGTTVHHDEVEIGAAAAAAAGLRIEPATRRPLGEWLELSATVTFNRDRLAYVSTPVAGRITGIIVRTGDWVEKGQVILRIDSPQLGEAQSAYLLALAETAAARTGLEIQQSSLERAQRLQEGQAISAGDYQKRESEYKAAGAALRSAEAACQAAFDRLRMTGMSPGEIEKIAASGQIQTLFEVRAPASGRIIERTAVQGETAGPERDKLAVIADTRTCWVLADLPESRIGQVRMGANAKLISAGLSERSLTGRIVRLDSTLDETTRTVHLLLEVDNPGELLKPGMFVRAGFFVESASGQPGGTLCVPVSAVLEYENSPTVFLAAPDEPDTYRARRITPGPAVSGLIPVLAGLQEGDRVVTAGAFIVKAELAKAIMEGKTCTGH